MFYKSKHSIVKIYIKYYEVSIMNT